MRMKRIVLSAASVWVQKHDLVLYVKEWEDRAVFPLYFCCLEPSIGLPFLRSSLPITVLFLWVFMGRCRDIFSVRIVNSQVLLGAISSSVCSQFIFQMTQGGPRRPQPEAVIAQLRGVPSVPELHWPFQVGQQGHWGRDSLAMKYNSWFDFKNKSQTKPVTNVLAL